MSCAIRHIVREPFVWKTSPGAWEVEPPVSKSGPWSRTRTSVAPSSARWWAALVPTMPAPTMTVSARSRITARMFAAECCDDKHEVATDATS